MHPKHQEAIKLRKKGKSYGEIKYALGVPKSTLSSWLKNFILPLSVQKILKEKRMAPRKQLMEFNRRRTRIIQTENNTIYKKAANQIKRLSRYELLLVGAALYWAEGYNKQGKIRSPYISFSNSNPEMVVLFIHFLQRVMKISKGKLKPTIQIHRNIKSESAINFWAKVTNVPKERFRVTCQISKASKGKRSRNSLPHGTLKLDVNGRQNFFQIKGWINGLVKQI